MIRFSVPIQIRIMIHNISFPGVSIEKGSYICLSMFYFFFYWHFDGIFYILLIFVSFFGNNFRYHFDRTEKKSGDSMVLSPDRIHVYLYSVHGLHLEQGV